MISIIVPIYNAEMYLRECLDSIVQQTYNDYEVILVNDGSSDESLSICMQYENKDSRFTVINNSNHGVSYSRNIGVKKAKGEYVAFIDADDKYDKDFLQILYWAINNYNADIAVCDYYNENGRENPGWESGLINQEKIFASFLHGYFCNRIMNKLYKYSVVKDVVFPENRPIMEDADWTSQVLLKCNSVYVVSKGKYYYRNVNNSLSRRKMTSYEEVGSFCNIINKYNIIANNITDTDIKYMTELIMGRLPWILLSFVNLDEFNTYAELRKLINNSIFDSENNPFFDIIRREEKSRKAQLCYYIYAIKNTNTSVFDKLKYTHRMLKYKKGKPKYEN